jgi:Rad3-related DNA helicase
MENDAAELLRKALHLPEAARAALADSLWRQEIQRRLQEIDSRGVKLIPWADIRRELLDRLEH